MKHNLDIKPEPHPALSAIACYVKTLDGRPRARRAENGD